MPQHYRLLFALIAALVVGGFTFLLQSNRDVLLENHWREAYGTFNGSDDPALMGQALAAAESEMKGSTCVGNWIGKDERYAYVAIGCGTFRQEASKISVTGDQNYRPVRFQLNGMEIKNPEVVEAATFENSLRRLFPRPAAERLEVRMNEQLYRERGLAKQQGRAAPAPAPAPIAPPKPEPSIPAK